MKLRKNLKRVLSRAGNLRSVSDIMTRNASLSVFSTNDAALIFSYVKNCKRSFIAGMSAEELHVQCFKVISQEYSPSAVKHVEQKLKLFFAVDIVIWVEGKLRGSQVRASPNGLLDLTRLFIATISDIRFRPLTAKELSHARCEVVFVKSQGEELSSAHSRMPLDTSYAYRASVSSFDAWYMPPTFNVRYYRTVHEALTSLYEDKLSGLATQGVRYFRHNVLDFIEDVDGTALPIKGTLIRREQSFTLANDSRLERAVAGLTQLCQHIRDDGSVRVGIPASGGVDLEQMDYIRTAYTLYALSVARSALKEGWSSYHEEKFQIVATFLRQEVVLSDKVPHEERLYALIYMSLAVKHRENAVYAEGTADAFEEILAKQLEEVKEVSLILTLAYYYQSRKTDTGEVHANLLFEKVFVDLEDKQGRGISIDYATYAGLLYAAKSKESHLARKGARLLTLFKSLLREDGLFPASSTHHHFYARGSSRLFEVCATLQDFKEAKEIALSLLGGIESLRYDATTLFCVPKELHAHFMDGIRESENDRSVYADAQGHYIVGMLNLLRHQ